MTFKTLSLEIGRVVEVRLTRATDGNPVDTALFDELERACGLVRDDASVRAVMLSDEGGADVGGRRADVGGQTSEGGGRRSAAEDGSLSEEGRLYIEGAAAAGVLPFRCLELLPVPVIAVIEAAAIGAGLELALACDVRVASEAATFSMPQVADGAMPRLGGTQRLPRIAGRSVASSMILLGTVLDAQAALACGLVNAVTAPGAARARAMQVAESIASRAPLAVRYAKEAVLRGLDMPLEQALRYETDLTVILQTTADRAEGVAAFLEKREPRFTGE